MNVLRMMGHTATWVGLVALALGGCGDDGTVTPPDDGTTTSASTTGTSTGVAPTGSSGETTSAPPTTGIDSTGTGEDTMADTTAGSTGSGSSESTGEPNLAPEATDDVYFVREDGAPLIVAADAGVLSNDSDPEDDALMVDDADAMTVAGGTVAVAADGSFEYTPPADFFGNDRFSYTMSDEPGGTATAEVIVTVAPAEIDSTELAAGMGGFVINGVANNDESGFFASGGGDVDGDGFEDMVITAVSDSGEAGRMWVVFGKADTAAVELSDVDGGVGGFAIVGESADDPLGETAAIVGDINGDGLADVLVGAPDAGFPGRAYLVHGKSDGAEVDLADVAMGIGGFSLDGAVSGEDAGTAVAAGGDVNGDGLADMLVGAPDGGPIPGGGRVYVVFGKTDTAAVALGDVFMGIGGFAIHGAGFDDGAGASVAGAGDVDGDGLADVLVGAQLANPGGVDNSGRCYVVFGRTDTAVVDLDMIDAEGFSIDGIASFDEACTAVAGLGDFNGDGLSDLLVGAPNDENDLSFQGRAYVIHGKPDNTPVLLADVALGMGGFPLDGEGTAHFLGLSASGAGDVDGDGLADLVLGAPNAGTPGIFAGRGYVVFGKTDETAVPLLELTNRIGGIRVLPESSQDQLGWSVSGWSDVNGDGLADALVSASRADPPAGTNAGRTFVVFGGNYSGALTGLGGPGDDVVEGDGSIDAIIGGAGADELHGGGSSDTIYGGAGDDVIGISGGQFFRLDGGTGTDTLAFDDDGVQLDLSLIIDAAIVDFEIIDLTGTGDNLLRLGVADLRAIVGPSRTLQVVGEATDTLEVDLTGAGFVDDGIDAGVHRWSNGVWTLEVVEPLMGTVTL